MVKNKSHAVVVVLLMSLPALNWTHAESLHQTLSTAERNRVFFVAEFKPMLFATGKPCSIVATYERPAYDDKKAVTLIETLGFYPDGMLKSQHYELNGKKDPHEARFVKRKQIVYSYIVEKGKPSLLVGRFRSRTDGYDILAPPPPFARIKEKVEKAIDSVRYIGKRQYVHQSIGDDGKINYIHVFAYDENDHLKRSHGRRPGGPVVSNKYYVLKAPKNRREKTWVYEEFSTIPDSKHSTPQHVSTLTYSQFDAAGNPTKVVAQHKVIAGYRKSPLTETIDYAYDYCSSASGQ